MRNVVLQSEQTADMHFDWRALNMNVHLAQERLDGKPARRTVLVQSGSSLERNQHNAEVWIFSDRVCGMFGLPRLLQEQAVNLRREIKGQ